MKNTLPLPLLENFIFSSNPVQKYSRKAAIQGFEPVLAQLKEAAQSAKI